MDLNTHGFTLMTLDKDGKMVDFTTKPDFLTNSEGETQACDCPPGMCLGGSDSFDGDAASLFDAILAAGPSDDDFDDEEGMTEFDRKEAVAQVGRIAEQLSVLAVIHAKLVRSLVDA